jgi:hypothetical protein
MRESFFKKLTPRHVLKMARRTPTKSPNSRQWTLKRHGDQSE